MLSPRPRVPGSSARRLRLVAGPAAEPVNFNLQKEALKLQVNSDSFSSMTRVRTARQAVENTINRKLVQQIFDLYLDDESFVGAQSGFFVPFYTYAVMNRHEVREIVLPFPPVQSVLGVYIRQDGVEQMVDPSVYSVSNAQEPCRIRLNNGQYWPEHDGFEAFRVRFTCGYATPVSVAQDGSNTLVGSNHGYREGDMIQFTSLDGTLPLPLEYGAQYALVNLTATSFQATDLSGNLITPDNQWIGTMFLGEVPSPLIEAMVLLSGLNLASSTPSRIPGVNTRAAGYELPVEPAELMAPYVWHYL